MKVYVKNVKGLKLPEQAHPNEDACFDVFSASEPLINGKYIERYDGTKMWEFINYIEYDTNLFFAPESENENNYHLKFFPRSSITKKNLILKNCVPIIDNGYRASVLLRFAYHFQPSDLVIVPEAGISKVYGIINDELIYKQFDKIAQFEAAKNTPIIFEIVEKLPVSQRQTGSFGSSDIKKV